MADVQCHSSPKSTTVFVCVTLVYNLWSSAQPPLKLHLHIQAPSPPLPPRSSRVLGRFRSEDRIPELHRVRLRQTELRLNISFADEINWLRLDANAHPTISRSALFTFALHRPPNSSCILIYTHLHVSTHTTQAASWLGFLDTDIRACEAILALVSSKGSLPMVQCRRGVWQCIYLIHALGEATMDIARESLTSIAIHTDDWRLTCRVINEINLIFLHQSIFMSCVWLSLGFSATEPADCPTGDKGPSSGSRRPDVSLFTAKQSQLPLIGPNLAGLTTEGTSMAESCLPLTCSLVKAQKAKQPVDGRVSQRQTGVELSRSLFMYGLHFRLFGPNAESSSIRHR
ncbi:unnamed protein product [Protopolystoma xenopodis]|uniref:Uncharacterized protein n=1 Tax=Protopolystoma xenopodis TaxID=117903 RepID=A0A448XHT6_9PLAT|nr:unnamed protein product [Protopolystoma xenopodis]